MVIRKDNFFDRSGLASVQYFLSFILVILAILASSRFGVAEALYIADTVNDLEEGIHTTAETDEAIKYTAVEGLLLGRDHSTLTNKQLRDHDHQLGWETARQICRQSCLEKAPGAVVSPLLFRERRLSGVLEGSEKLGGDREEPKVHAWDVKAWYATPAKGANFTAHVELDAEEVVIVIGCI